MAEMNSEVTRKVAHLAKLALSESEIQILSGQLEKVLTHIQKLEEVDVKGVEPMNHPLDLEPPMREDIVLESPKDQNGNPKVLEPATDVEENSFKVPRIIS